MYVDAAAPNLSVLAHRHHPFVDALLLQRHNEMSTWNDPLTIDIQKQLSAALRVLPIGSPFTSVLQNLEPNGTCLPTISRLLQKPSLTVIIKTAFQPLLVDLCARWLDDDECLDKKLDAFALLVEVHEEIAQCVYMFLVLIYVFLLTIKLAS